MTRGRLAEQPRGVCWTVARAGERQLEGGALEFVAQNAQVHGAVVDQAREHRAVDHAATA